MIDHSFDYHPWTAEFKSGLILSRRAAPSLKFSEVLRDIGNVKRFTIHFPGHDVSIHFFHSGARFFAHGEWRTHPKDVAGPYTLHYLRRCVATMWPGGKITSNVAKYVIGYTTPTGAKRYMELDPAGDYAWVSDS